ncbi:MAG TPA: DUF402 domain-containing protein [Dehalococcoidia bacterium]|nr:DUF402 domain-containing protein [Dehalococcoidia bacterium]
MTEKRWQRGDTVMVRYPMEERMVRCYQVITGDPVVNVVGWPHVVLEDSDERIALYMPEGTHLWRWDVLGERLHQERIVQGELVRLFFPGKRFEVSLFYDTGTGPARHVEYLFPGVRGRFFGWKVDVTSLFARTEIGFDMIDETLDIMMKPDRTHRWKDEDQLEVFVDLGIYSKVEVEELHRIGEDVVRSMEKREPPFDDEWVNWRPEPGLKIGQIPVGWQDVPVPSPYRAYDLSEDSSARIAASSRLPRETRS